MPESLPLGNHLPRAVNKHPRVGLSRLAQRLLKREERSTVVPKIRLLLQSRKLLPIWLPRNRHRLMPRWEKVEYFIAEFLNILDVSWDVKLCEDHTDYAVFSYENFITKSPLLISWANNQYKRSRWTCLSRKPWHFGGLLSQMQSKNQMFEISKRSFRARYLRSPLPYPITLQRMPLTVLVENSTTCNSLV